MNINQHFINLATKAAQDGADASQVISQRNRLFQDKVVPALVKRGANDTAIVQAREKWYSQTDKVMQSAGLLPKAGQSSRSFAKDKRADKAVQEAVKTGINLPIIKEALKSTGETIGNLFGQGVGGMIEGAAGFVRDIGENEKNSTSARIAKYGKNLKKDYENSASTFQKELQGGQHGKIPQLSAGAIQSVPAMALPFGAAKGVATVATKVPILASKAPYLGIVAGKAAEHTQNYGEVRRNATANLERDFPTWEKLQGNPLFEQNFNERLNNGLTITQAREQAYAATLDQLSEKASDKYGTAMTAIGFIAPSGAVLGSGILKNAPTSKIGKALTGGGVDSALVKREMQQVPRTGMAKLVPDMSIAANKAAAKMVGKQALEEGLQGGIGEYGAQAASANIGGTPVDYGKVGQTILEEGLVGGIMGGGMQSATGGSPTSQAKDVAKQLRNQTNTLRQEEAAARKELADAMQLNDPAALQSAQDNLNNIGAEASKVKAAYDQYGIDTPYFVERFAAQYQPPKQQEQEPPVVEPEVQPEVQPEVEPQPTEQPQATPINQGMANTTNLVMDSVSNGYITPEEAQVIQTDPIQLEQGEDYWKEVKRVGRTIGHTFSGGKIDKAKVDKDLKKVGDLMFENTLMDNSERHSVKELKQLGFDDDQIGLYNEVRDAIDTSLDTFANTTFSNIYKHLGGTNEEVLELAAQDLDIVDHYNEILKRIDTLTKGKPEKAEARQAAIEAIGVNTVLMDGIVNLNPWIDVKGRMGMGDLIPATAYFSPTTSDYMKSSEISQIAGPIGGLLEKVKESVALAQVGAYGQSGVQLLPKAITSVGQGAIAATTGDYRNMKTGVKTNDVEAWEGIIKMLDAQPASIAKEGRFRGMELKDKSAQTYVNARWKERYVNALESGDRTQVRAVKQEINDYNKDNPRYPIKFNQKLAETNYNKSNQTWQEKRKIVKGLEWMSEYNPHLKQ